MQTIRGAFKMNRLNINNNGVEIDGILINEKIFQKEKIKAEKQQSS